MHDALYEPPLRAGVTGAHLGEPAWSTEGGTQMVVLTQLLSTAASRPALHMLVFGAMAAMDASPTASIPMRFYAAASPTPTPTATPSASLL
ncbi:hypothetical protein MMPV_001429 [Pyropia vietnamensis]